MNKPCDDCRLFFLELHRRCTIHLNGGCDCPICQGICDCKVAIREALPRSAVNSPPVLSHPVAPSLPWAEQDGDYTVYPVPGRKFGQKRK